jgi:hypothetical protein
MQIKAVKYLIFLVFGLLFGSLGFYREYFFANINNVMYLQYNGDTTVPVNPSFQMFLELPYKTVYYLKYLFTFVFVGMFFLLSYWCIKYYTNDKKLLKWFTYSYLVLLLLSSVLMLWAYFIKVKLDTDEYSLSRWLMGIAQSPLPALFFIATAKLNKNLN